MGSLQNARIDQSYPGIIKTNDEAGIGGVVKTLQDGVGTDLPMQVSTSTVVFTGNVVGDNNTTYDLASAQSGSDVDVTLTGSDATTDTVKLVAGTNVTLTDSGTNQITIDAAGGGGAAGLVSNGANGMKSDASLTTNPALSTGTNSIVLGDNARDEGNNNAIAIGLNARVREPGAISIGANSEAYDNSIAIGNNAYAVYPGISIGEGAQNFGSGNAVVIGQNNGTNYSNNIINIGGGTSLGSDNNDNIVVGSTVNVADGTAERNIYIGNDIAATTNGVDDNVIIGHGATTNTGTGVTIVGSGASATVDGAVALGAGVTAAKVDTVSIKALETQTPSTPTAGGIIMTDAGSTERRLNIDASGNLQIDSTPVGGGADQAEGQNITPALGGSSLIYSIPWTLSGYSKTAARAFSGNDAMFVPFYAKPGETIDDFYFRIQTAQAGALMNVGLYKSYEATINVNQKVLMPEYVATLATNVDVSTTGKKSFTGLAQSLPSDAVGGLYWIAFLCDTAAVALTKWSNWVANERVIYSDIYRGNGVDYAVGSMTLPTGQVNISSATASTDLSVDFAWTYQS